MTQQKPPSLLQFKIPLQKVFMLFLVCWSMLGLVGCDCDHEGQGFVYDKATGQPLEGVEVDVFRPAHLDEMLKYRVVTKADGSFHMVHQECGDYMLNFGKEGYIDFLADCEDDMKIELERE